MTQPTASYRELRRPRDNRMVAGVAAGLARYLNIDPTIIRLAFAVAAFVTWGGALLIYPVLWMIMPEER